MANQPELVQYDSGVYQLEIIDPVDGGVGAVSNKPLLNLANRTAYLKKHIDDLEAGNTIPPTLAPINSPAFTGSPTAPTPALGDNSTKVSTTAFVQGTVNGVLTKSVAGGSNVTLTTVEAGNGLLVFTGALTANISVNVPATSKSWVVSNQTTGAFSLTVKTSAGTGIVVAQGKNQELWCDGTNVLQSTNDFASVALTGTSTAPTPASGDNSTTISNTAFVFNATDGLSSISVAGNTDVTLSQAQYGTAILNLTGALTGNINLKFPQQTGQWVVANNSSGAFAITGKTTAAGTPATVTLPQGSAVLVYSDGTNMYLASSAGGQLSFTPTSFAPAAGTTSLNVPTGYTPGAIFLEKNGALLEPADFTATNGSTITVAATTAGDKFTLYAFKTFTVANTVQKSGDTMGGALALTAGSTAPTPSAGDNSTNLATTAFASALAAHGQCRLTVASTTSLKLAPLNGNLLNINGTPQQIPGAGVTFSNSGLAASTLYYAYVYMNAGVMTGELVATGHSTNTNGVEIKTGDATRTLVGMIYTNASSQFVDGSTQRFCLNWFNRRPIAAINRDDTQYTFTTSGSSAEISSNLRLSYLTWANENTYYGCCGSASNSGNGYLTSVNSAIDSNAYNTATSQNTSAGAGYAFPFSCAALVNLPEGLHTQIVAGSVSTTTTGTLRSTGTFATING